MGEEPRRTPRTRKGNCGYTNSSLISQLSNYTTTSLAVLGFSPEPTLLLQDSHTEAFFPTLFLCVCLAWIWEVYIYIDRGFKSTVCMLRENQRTEDKACRCRSLREYVLGYRLLLAWVRPIKISLFDAFLSHVYHINLSSSIPCYDRCG